MQFRVRAMFKWCDNIDAEAIQIIDAQPNPSRPTCSTTFRLSEEKKMNNESYETIAQET